MTVQFTLEPLDGASEMSGTTAEDIEVVRLLVEDGATVEPGQEVIEVVGDKANVALPAPAGGVLCWEVQEGDLLQPGDVLATIEGR